ncbi:MAG: redoxin domain-containing protein [Acidimicrobiia bacterium]|nr:redoxin domain-containing protein [Acidimicrobiia bacterium]
MAAAHVSHADGDTSPVARPARRTGRLLAVALVATMALVMAACGSDDPTTEAGAAPVTGSTSSGFPDVAVTEVGTGSQSSLADLNGSDLPILAWFWAPDCATCRTLAPAVNEFAEANVGRVEVVGLGTRNDPDYAERFAEDVGVSFPLVWEDNGASWRHFGVRSQPVVIMVAPDGSWVDRTNGLASVEELQAMLDSVPS